MGSTSTELDRILGEFAEKVLDFGPIELWITDVDERKATQAKAKAELGKLFMDMASGVNGGYDGQDWHYELTEKIKQEFGL